MADLNKIIDDLSSLTVVEAAELSKQLEEKWGVTAAAAVAPAPATGAAGGAAPEEEKDELVSFRNIKEYLSYSKIIEISEAPFDEARVAL